MYGDKVPFDTSRTAVYKTKKPKIYEGDGGRNEETAKNKKKLKIKKEKQFSRRVNRFCWTGSIKTRELFKPPQYPPPAPSASSNT